MTDWNAISDVEFRKEVRQFFEAEYPEELRHLPHRPATHDRAWITRKKSKH